MKKHERLAVRLRELGISHRAAARDLGVAASTFGFYVKDGRLTATLEGSDFVARLERYIAIKEKEIPREKEVKAEPMRGKFSQLGMTLDELARTTGVSRPVLTRGIYRGLWPDEPTFRSVTAWMERELQQEGDKKMLTKISLPQEVQDHFALKNDPFTNEMEDTDDILDTKENSKAERKIMNAVEKSGWTAITGPVGSGKTTLLKKIESRLAKRRDIVIVKPRMIEKQFLGASHICTSILEDLGGQSVSGQRTLEYKARLVGRVLEEAFKEGKKVVILIDEAHLLTERALSSLKRIYEFEIGFKKLLSIVLVGQQSLARQLKTNFTLAEVSQRVDLYELGSLNGALGAYVRHKLERAGAGAREIFEGGAIKAMAKKVDTPLSVNNLAAALIAAQDIGDKTVSAAIIDSIHVSY